MKYLSFIFLILSISLLSACSNIPAEATPLTSQSAPSITHTKTNQIVVQTKNSITPFGNSPIPIARKTTKPTTTPNLKLTQTAQVWLNQSNLAFSAAGMGFNLAQSYDTEYWKIFSEEINPWWNWSSDGSQVAFSTNSETTIINLESGAKISFPISGSITWHPDGNVLVVSSQQTLHLLNSFDGVELDQLSIGTSGWNDTASFSSDGSKLAYLTDRLYIVDLELDEDNQPFEFGYYQDISSQAALSGVINIIRACWSPDGDRIAVVDMNWPSEPYVAIITAEGNLISRVEIPDRWEQEFSWSPDGQYLVVISDSETTPTRIYVANKNGGGLVRVDEYYRQGDVCINWTSNSKYLTYTRYSSEGLPSIILSDVAGIQKRILPLTKIFGENSLNVCMKPRPQREFPLEILPTSTPDPMCTIWPQLKVNGYAKLVDVSPNRVRSAPEKGDNLISQLPPGTVVKVLEGPVCADGLVFWKVESDTIPGGVGWTAEGDGSEYWLESYSP